MKIVSNLVGLKIFSKQFEDIDMRDGNLIDNDVPEYELIRYNRDRMDEYGTNRVRTLRSDLFFCSLSIRTDLESIAFIH